MSTVTLAILLPSLVVAGAPLAPQVDDASVASAIESEFITDTAVPSDEIDVLVDEGVVTLTGSVPHLLAKERAVHITEIVKGVRSVVDRLEVDPPRIADDTVIEHDVTDALLRDPATDSYEIAISVNEGVVTLIGDVESWSERRLCETVAKSAVGVRDVVNQITVSFDTERPDAEIRQEIERTLEWDALVDAALVDVSVEDGAVTLAGTVGSAAEKRRARQQAWVAGTTSVDAGDLQVARWARDDDLREDEYAARPDDEVEQAVIDALGRDPRVFSFNVDVDVDGGRVTLSGIVDNLSARRAAETDARNTVGAHTVINHLKVRPVEARGDDAIAADVRRALLVNPIVDRYAIDVDVHDGRAILSGTVDSHYEKAQADTVASRVNGVVDVSNHLLVAKPVPYAYDPWVDTWNIYDFDWYDTTAAYSFTPDWRIENQIESELYWSPFVDADEVEVSVADGVATLTGRVDSRLESGAARDNAYEGGATYVRNQLDVAATAEDDTGS